MSDTLATIIQVDPAVQGWQAAVGAFAYSFSTGFLYIKTGSTKTEWTRVQTGTGGGTVQSVTGAASGIVDNTDPTNPVIQAQFGSDTTINLPNAASANVSALRLVTDLPVNTAGAETGRFKLTLPLAGVQKDSMVLLGSVMQIPDGLYFINDAGQDTGFQRNGGDNFSAMAGNQAVATFTSGGITLNAGIGAFLSWGGTAGYVRYSSVNGTTTVAPADANGNTQLGLNGGAALATNATHGFAAIQTCAGTPTGVPTADTGFAPLVVNTTNNKLHAYYGGAWHDLTGA